MFMDFFDFVDFGCLFMVFLVVFFIVCCLDLYNRFFFFYEGYWCLVSWCDYGMICLWFRIGVFGFWIWRKSVCSYGEWKFNCGGVFVKNLIWLLWICIINCNWFWLIRLRILVFWLFVIFLRIFVFCVILLIVNDCKCGGSFCKEFDLIVVNLYDKL